MSAPSRRRRPLHRLDVWFGLLGGHLAWTAHLLVSYAIVETVCPRAPSGAELALHGVTVATGLAAVASGWVAWRVFRRGQAEGAAGERLLGIVGVLLAALNFATILTGGIGPLVFETCAYQ